MGAKCCGSGGKLNTKEFYAVREQNMLIDNKEVRVMHIDGEKMNKGKGEEVFDGYLQRQSYFVVPQIDKLKKEKIEWKSEMQAGSNQQKFAKLRVVNAGDELTKKGTLYYVSVI